MGACFGSNSKSAVKTGAHSKDPPLKAVAKDQFDLSQHDDLQNRIVMRREAEATTTGGILAPKARRGIVQRTPSPTEDDDCDLTQHDGRNLAFQMKSSNVQPSPFRNGATTGGLMRNLSVESFGTLAKLVEEEHGNTVMAGKRGDLESVAFTHEDFGPEAIDHNGEDNIVSVLYAGKTKKGFAPNNPTKRNQDSFFMQNDIATSSLVIACFDGHGQFGHDVSKYCKKYMESNLVVHPLFLKDLHMAILDVTASLERDMMTAAHVDTVFSGTTMVLIVMQGTIITVANVGDSRVILGYQKDISPPSGSYPRPLTRASIISPDSPETSHEEISLHDKQTVNAASLLDDKVRAARKASSNVVGASTKEYDNTVDLEGVEDNRLWGHITTMPLSTDQKPDDPKEAAVIIAAGGRVKEVHGTHRVYLALDDVPGLAMSRSLGDYVAHSAGVSSIPEVFQYDLTALYSDEIKVESTKSDSQAVGIPMGDKDGPVVGITRISSEGEVAVRCVLLIATDGLFDMMTNDTAVSSAFKHWGNPAAAAAEMIAETGKDWMATWGLADDTTVCVVNLEHAGSPLRASTRTQK